MKSKHTQEIAGLLRSTQKAHHQLFASAVPANDEWANWYAKYLLDKTNFLQLVERDWSKEDLSLALLALSESFEQAHSKNSWDIYYAERLIT